MGAYPAYLSVEVVYAEPLRGISKMFRIASPASAADVLRLAAADRAFAGVDTLQAAIGIFGKRVAADQSVADGDRIEIYRPLAADPKSERRLRARVARKKASKSDRS
jgi:putative ubiquitin-RnfH superfamily antitoxin RatB of RatAB toxin-antitoxin module